MDEKITILYIDDEPINLLMFRKNFELKYKVITAQSSSLALDILSKNNEIRLVVSDLRMPEMDGVEFIRHTKAIYPHLPFFILTGFEVTREIEEALDEKVISKYFRKPFDLKAIDEAIGEVVTT